MTLSRINKIKSDLEIRFGKPINNIPFESKLKALCDNLLITPSDLDYIIAKNPQVLRTVKGHCFEVVFTKLLAENGYKVETVGGDSAIDLSVNNITLQLKTPNVNGTTKERVEYKTHKTHGAKSQSESMKYFHSVAEFADFFVGLISYTPLSIFILPKNLLPLHPQDNNYIQSPFKLNIRENDKQSPYINNYANLGISITKESIENLYPDTVEILPLSSSLIGVKSEIIIDSIFGDGNFRIWDMSIRGFASELIVKKIFELKKIKFSEKPEKFKSERGEKADLAVFFDQNIPSYIQIKGVSIRNCKIDGINSIIACETQLTRGRINDHPTQSRLYEISDFNSLMLCIDPSLSKSIFDISSWLIFLIPSDSLKRHNKYPNRYNAIQKFKATDLKKYLYAEYPQINAQTMIDEQSHN